MLLNKERALRIMSEKGFDALVSTAQENNAYFGDIPVKGFCLFPLSGAPALIARTLDAFTLAETPSWIEDVRFYGLFHIITSEKARLHGAEERMNELVSKGGLAKYNDPIDVLMESIRENHLENKTIGIDGSGIALSQYERLKKRLPDAKLIDASEDIAWIRAVKTRQELENIRTVTKVTEKGFDAVEKAAGKGVSEKELAVAYRKAVATEEEVSIRFYTFLGGGRGAVPLAPPSKYRLKRGDLIQLHSSLVYKYYHSDIARGAVVGKPSEKQVRTWNAIVKGEEKVIDSIRPGIKASELFKIGVQTVRDWGLPGYERWHVGHGVGLALIPNYDPPTLAPSDDREIEENMVLCIETPYYEIGFGGMNLEDTGVVTQKGFRLFSSHRSELKIV